MDGNNKNDRVESESGGDIWEKLLSGAVAGVVGTIIVFPIDSIKTRVQSGWYPKTFPLNGFNCARQVFVREGITGFYRGLSANIIGVIPEKAIKLAVNDHVRGYFSGKLGTSPDHLPIQYGLTAGAIAGFCQVIATNPMEMVKIQMQLSSQQGLTKVYGNQLGTIVKKLGLGGLYRGSLSTLCRDIPFSIMFFQGFVTIKNTLSINFKTDPSSPSFVAILSAGMLSGGLSAFLATPMDGTL